PMPEARQYAPATERNRQPILEALQQILPATGTVLEIASGTGEHAAFFAPRLSQLQWLPSEPEAERIASIQAWREAALAENLLPPVALDVSENPWPIEQSIEQPVKQTGEQTAGQSQRLAQPITAIVNINMIHISPWTMCEHLMAGAQRILPVDGVLYLYGPFKQKGEHTAPSNEAFDHMLRDRNSQWGVRDLETVCQLAQQHHLHHSQTIAMPANNLSVIFHRQ
ncbi:MAG: DUF938 domain-containing protein, partial [Phormidesmis sp.]